VRPRSPAAGRVYHPRRRRRPGAGRRAVRARREGRLAPAGHRAPTRPPLRL